MNLVANTIALLIVLSNSVVLAQDTAGSASPAGAVAPDVTGLLQRVSNGDANAMNALGNLYLKGEGVPQSGTEAIRLFKKSVELGNAEGAMNLGRAYFRGRGVQFDQSESTKWFKVETAMREGRSITSAMAANEKVGTYNLPPDSVGKDVCNRQVTPEMPKTALKTGKGGLVKAQVLIVGDQIRDVSILSGPQLFHDNVVAAIRRYQCEAVDTYRLAYQEFAFAVTDEQGNGFLYRVDWSDRWNKVKEPAFNADWAGLNNAQRRVVRAHYANLPASYEPPYPTNGLAALVEDIRVFAEHWLWKGKFSLEVSVDANGAATSVNVSESPNDKARQYAAAVAFNAHYKPGMCDGKPCAMVFPIEMDIVRAEATHSAKYSLEDRASKGDANAQNLMGERYEYGRTVAKDFSLALGWYRKAAQQGLPSGQNNLARMLEAGRGVERNYPEALTLYRAAAEHGYAPSQNNYGYMLARGQGTLANPAEALKWFERSAQQGYAPAQLNLGDAYMEGQGVARDVRKAVELYQRGMDSEEERGTNIMALLYMFGFRDAINVEEVLQHLLVNTRLGLPGSAAVLGMVYVRGAGLPQSDEKAFQLFLRSANAGNAAGQLQLANSYEKGRGTPVNLPLAFAWYEKAAAGGNSFAAMRLSEMYAEGNGVAKNPEAAKKLESQAKEKKYSDEIDDMLQLTLFNRVAQREAGQKLIGYRDASIGEVRAAIDKLGADSLTMVQ